MMSRLLCLFTVLGAASADPTVTVTETTTQTATTTQTWTITQSAAVDNSVHVSLLIEGIDYSLLVARPALRSNIELDLRQAFAVGQAFSASNIAVTLSSGSLLVTFKITADAPWTSLAQQIRLTKDAIAQRAAAALRTIPGIAEVTVGTLTVRICGAGQTKAEALMACAANVKPEPQGSMPANLDSAVAIGGIAAQDGLLNAFEGGSAQGPHPAFMFGLGAATALALAVPLSKKWNSSPALAISTEVE